MALKGLTGGVYQPLSSADIETIHQTSLTILENTGISYESGLEETIKILDLESGRARPTTLNDMYQIGRLVDGLDNIHFFLRPCIPTDIPENKYDANPFLSV